MENVVKRVIDDRNDAHEQYELYRKRYKACKRMVFFLFVQLGLFLGYRIGRPEIFCLDPVDLRLYLHHLDGIFLYPYRQRQQYYFCQKRKQDYCKPVVAQKSVAEIHGVTKRYRDNIGYCLHALHPHYLIFLLQQVKVLYHIISQMSISSFIN